MVKRPTIVSAMAAHLPTGRGSPVSIHGLPVLRQLQAAVRSRGFDWIALEHWDHDPARGAVTALWDFGSISRLPNEVMKAAEGRVVAWSLESPLVAHRGYHHLPKIAKNRIAHVVSYPGLESLIEEGSVVFHPVGWPNSMKAAAARVRPWQQRQLLVMINSNKRLHQWREGFAWARLKPWGRLVASSVVAKSYRLRGQWQVPDLYNERLRAVAELGQHPDFTLLGVGWSTRLPGWTDTLWKAVKESYEGEVADKNQALQQFRFALCIENTIFPGYISEKIFDAFRAGTIPIYLGAPDVDSFIPKETFLDLRGFASYEDLMDSLKRFDEATARSYITAARAFLASPAASIFSEDHFLNETLRAITAAARSGRYGKPV